MNYKYNVPLHRFSVISSEFQNILKKEKRFTTLTQRIRSQGGRVQGLIVSPRRGDFNKRIYRFIDFKRIIFPEEPAYILQTQYDPMRAAYIALTCYSEGLFTYILQPGKTFIGNPITNLARLPQNIGDSASLSRFPAGVLIHNIGGIISRSAGCAAIIIRQERYQSLLKLKSGELRYFNTSVMATKGVVSNETHFLNDLKKAGKVRYLGKRPRTRPSSMNPVDHPMGGRTRGGKQPVNSHGIITNNRSTKKYYHPSILKTKRQLKLFKQ